MLFRSARLAAGSLVEWGLQRACNAAAHLDYLQERGVHVRFWDELGPQEATESEQLGAQLSELAEQHHGLSLSVDLDAFAQSVAPGVSAPSPVGVSASAVVRAAARLGQLTCTTQLGIYELNPRFDQDGQTARLAARLAWSYLTGCA